ncbi:DNA polymerase III subunit delta [Brevibacillus borstelensis]|uniref:DNA polymerase III subunit delta n=1 Tax=Brevibacillus borstelensis TaxID=45462 RepID=UPI001D0A605C|nr:DNA polymerase III subunit delta [Brevibacillus borstelensis]MCC0564463.1 DNA polymerase III subunit delta [Brevibacillus borstelensis]MCM3471183.1 DNA polymerase III subunit delta [Brevibacillus borstelensis]MCM3559657.1 DNA polymerase III subunit delta [Brevibacillus borstelensis]MCM3591369.1 DNA polymerase III subunit delta [Brevibacillus borstelensis]MCM3623912.1 DNA polymerase III subunit delta [Brevibacillus borstelensis]
MPLLSAIREIRQKQFAPIYVLYGPESFLAEEFMTLAKREMIDPAYADLNLSVYDCTETPLSHILQDAETLPFLGEHRLVIAKQAYFLTGSKPQTKHESDPNVLIPYLEQPPSYTTLILYTDADKLDERKKLVKSLQQKARVIPFPYLRDSDLYAWIERQAQKYETSMERSLAAKLAERIGGDLRLLDKELEKMSLYVGGKGGVITDEVIEKLASRTLEQDVFALIEQIAAGRLDKGLRMLYDCLKTGEEPIRLLALMARQFRLLLHVRQWAPKGYSQQQLAGMLKVHPYAVKKAGEQARYFSEEALRKLLAILAEEDFRMKSGQVDKRLALELFMTRVFEERMKAKRS